MFVSVVKFLESKKKDKRLGHSITAVSGISTKTVSIQHSNMIYFKPKDTPNCSTNFNGGKHDIFKKTWRIIACIKSSANTRWK